MKKVAVIAARAGSKGIPGKNSKNLAGKPLVLWTIQQAIASSSFDSILLSTDSDEIATLGKNSGIEVPFLRPASLATDDASSVDVVLHSGQYLELAPEDIVCLLEPTSPLRCLGDIPNAIKLLENQQNNYQAVISAGQVKAHPYTTFKLIDGSLEANFPKSNKLRRQDMPKMFYPYGGIYATFFENLVINKTFYPTRLGLIELQPQQHLEIDEPDDFVLAEMLIQRYRHLDGIHMKLESSDND